MSTVAGFTFCDLCGSGPTVLCDVGHHSVCEGCYKKASSQTFSVECTQTTIDKIFRRVRYEQRGPTHEEIFAYLDRGMQTRKVRKKWRDRRVRNEGDLLIPKHFYDAGVYYVYDPVYDDPCDEGLIKLYLPEYQEKNNG